MTSDIYKACGYNEIDYLRILIETSLDDAKINQLESNGSTVLHLACSKGYTDIVRLLLNDRRVDRHQTNINGQTAYQVASTDEIRQLFPRQKRSDNPFCTNQNTLNPLECFINENASDSHYTTYYPTQAPIMTECLLQVHDHNYNTITVPIINGIRRFFGNDPEKNKIDKWVENLQLHIVQYFTAEDCQLSSEDYSKTNTDIKEYYETKNVEYLLKLYTLHTSICKSFAQDSIKTEYLYAPISFHLSNLSERAYKGLSFRGLTMKENEFMKYKQAFQSQDSYIRTNTFCSTSADPVVAEMFTIPKKIKGIINVIMMFDFVKSCSTAITLFSSLSKLKCISQFDDEQEILVLPGTIFSVKNIQEDDQTHITTIHLENFDTSEAEHEIHQERFQSYIDTFFTDT
ncbi:unnamed protein product [Adineta steineri]|uniref:NAD(+)--protein-arginine ADP-ribosyltransferase n=1 Tax=Adineta steineri TaxID=433720 RepID=A0A816DHH2_9BILA|nr:unnamed protein product [Adineta steineri]CAF1636489.1 unnamed protein product [Adineta steineri]